MDPKEIQAVKVSYLLFDFTLTEVDPQTIRHRLCHSGVQLGERDFDPLDERINTWMASLIKGLEFYPVTHTVLAEILIVKMAEEISRLRSKDQ